MLQSSHTALGQYSECQLERRPLQSSHMHMLSSVVAVTLIVYSMNNWVANRTFQPSPVPADVLEQTQAGVQLYHRTAEFHVLAGRVRRASASTPPGTGADLERPTR